MYIPNVELLLQKNIVKQRQPILYHWFSELEKTVNTSTTSDKFNTCTWQLLGQGFLVEGEDQEAYIHFLQWAASALNIDLIELSRADLSNLKNLVSKLSKPTIVYLKPDKWLGDEDLSDEDLNEQQALIEVFALIEYRPIILTSICGSYGEINELFRHRGRFDRHISWTAPHPELYAEDFIGLLGSDHLDDKVITNKKRLGSLLCADFASLRRLGMLSITSQRKSAFLDRKLSWKDILEIAIRGTGDGVYGHPNNNLAQIASHEAGHAVITIIESNGKNVPDYISVLPGKDMLGVMVEDYEHSYASLGYMSFALMQSKIRIMLAGRAGEEVLLGELGVGVDTANTDLREATWQAITLMARGGFHADYGKTSIQKGNAGLLVSIRNKVPENADYFQEQARQFLAEQYAEVKKILQTNKELLRSLQEALIDNKILLQEDVGRIFALKVNQGHIPLAA